MNTLPSWLYLLVNAGHAAPSADNSQPWRFDWDGRSLSLDIDAESAEEGLGRSHPVVRMALGAVIENMFQAAVAAGLSTESWQFGYSAPDDVPLLQVPGYSEGTPSGNVPDWIRHRHTNRGKYSTEPLSDAIVSELSLLTEGDLGLHVFTEAKSIRQLGDLVGQASEIRFQTEAVHRWLEKSLRFTKMEVSRGDGLDVETLALPPGGGQLLRFISDWRRMKWLNRVRAYKFFAAIEKQQFAQCGAVVIVTGTGSPQKRDWVSAGRLMERAWLLMTRQGVSVHPYFVLPDVFYRYRSNLVPEGLTQQAEEIIRGTQEMLPAASSTPFMVLRVGFAKQEARPSRRLPLEAVFHSTAG